MEQTYEGEFNGVKYNSYLVSRDGVEIVLYKQPHHSREDIKKAKQIARNERDVVHFTISRINEEQKMTHTLKGDSKRNVWLDGKWLDPERSQKVRNHSPDGFSWGYGGSGPSQLALAVVLELTGKPDGYQDFKWEVIAKIPDWPLQFYMEFNIKDGEYLINKLQMFEKGGQDA